MDILEKIGSILNESEVEISDEAIATLETALKNNLGEKIRIEAAYLRKCHKTGTEYIENIPYRSTFGPHAAVLRSGTTYTIIIRTADTRVASTRFDVSIVYRNKKRERREDWVMTLFIDQTGKITSQQHG